jgi:flagellar M-ring protein FliF
MNFLQKIVAIWQKVSLVQRALLIAIVMTFAIGGTLLVHWARTPDMSILYQDLAPEEAAKITDKISEKSIPYELRNGGKSIYVPKEKVYQLRLDMAKEGLPVAEQGGYSLFDNEKIGISPFVQNVNLKRALQDELAKSIQMIEGVAHARVHIVSVEQTVFSSQASQTSASVILKLKPGYKVDALNIAAITNLVAGSVESLKSENVTVIDSKGRLLSASSDQKMTGGASTAQDYRERIEQNLAGKVEDMLTAVLGPGRASVKISAIVDMTSTDVVTEIYEPKGVPTKEEIKSESETGAGKAATEGQTATGSSKKGETITTELAVGKTVKRETALPGSIKSLSVAAVVDLLPNDANATSGKQAAKIMEVSAVEKLIKDALGLDLQKLDSLTVVEAKFSRPTELLTDKDSDKKFDIMAIARHASMGIMAICAIIVLKMFSGAKKKAELAASQQLPEASGAAGFLPAGTSDPMMLRKHISGVLQNNPEQAKQLFTNWINEKR